MTSTRPGGQRAGLLTGRFTAWLAASTVAATGEGIVYFAIGWAASSLGARTAGLMLTLVVLPRTLLMLVGGAVGDRWGLRRTVIVCDGCTCGVFVVFLVLQGSPADSGVLLAALAVTIGVTSAFRLPAAGAFPRLFADDDGLARAMSVTSSLLQVARLIGPALGGAVVVVAGMAGAVTTGLAGFMVVLVVCLLVKPPYERPPDADERSSLRRINEGLLTARGIPGVPALLGAVALIAAGVLPVLTLGVPLAARSRGWSAGVTGLIEGIWVAGTLSVTLLVARYGTRRRPIGILTAGPALVGIGALIIAASPEPAGAMAGALAMGVGTALFTTHVFPLYLLHAPHGMVARFQALLGLVQAASLLAANNVVGAVAGNAHTARAIAVLAGLDLLAAILVLASPTLRKVRFATSMRN